jgi:hypothetical protein
LVDPRLAAVLAVDQFKVVGNFPLKNIAVVKVKSSLFNFVG